MDTYNIITKVYVTRHFSFIPRVYIATEINSYYERWYGVGNVFPYFHSFPLSLGAFAGRLWIFWVALHTMQLYLASARLSQRGFRTTSHIYVQYVFNFLCSKFQKFLSSQKYTWLEMKTHNSEHQILIWGNWRESISIEYSMGASAFEHGCWNNSNHLSAKLNVRRNNGPNTSLIWTDLIRLSLDVA